ncbi:MAG: hypothetical protein ACPLX7_10300 [Candidatus Kapaibacteriota bacterium]
MATREEIESEIREALKVEEIPQLIVDEFFYAIDLNIEPHEIRAKTSNVVLQTIARLFGWNEETQKWERFKLLPEMRMAIAGGERINTISTTRYTGIGSEQTIATADDKRAWIDILNYTNSEVKIYQKNVGSSTNYVRVPVGCRLRLEGVTGEICMIANSVGKVDVMKGYNK